MRPQDWPRVKELFMAAVALDRDARTAYLADTCDDPALRAEVESLLASHDQSGVLDTPAAALLSIPAVGDLIGRRIGTYTIDALIGRGGMGEVYRAHDSKLDRPVALKLLPAAGAADPERLRRFNAEARAASSLNHPHILVIHDFGEVDGRPFIVTELVEGQTLRARLRQGPITPTDAFDIAGQIASALAAAHARGLVHRDIKPENVMLRGDGYVKVLDFGLAKLQATPDTVGGDARNQTTPGAVVGTPRYMSPEQARGQDVDARTDVWSLGAVLYEMLTGAPPFDGPSANDVIAAVLMREPAPLGRAPAVPAAVGDLLVRALAKDPARRFATAERFQDALAAARSGPMRRVPFKRMAAVTAVAASIGAGTFAIVRELRPIGGAPPTRPRAAAPSPAKTAAPSSSGVRTSVDSLWTVKALAGPAPVLGFWSSAIVGKFGCGKSVTFVLPAETTIDATQSMHMSASEPHAVLSVEVSRVGDAVAVDVDARLPAGEPCAADGKSFYSMVTTLEITTTRPGVITVRHDLPANDRFRTENVRFATRRTLDDWTLTSNWTMPRAGTVWAVLQLANDDDKGNFSEQDAIGRLYTITFQPEAAGRQSSDP